MLSLTSNASWKGDSEIRIEIMLTCSDSLILPQALAAHLLILDGGQAITKMSIHNHFWTLVDNAKAIGVKWEDRLQSSLFSIASYEAGSKVILKAMDLASQFEISHGIEPRNYVNWGYVQGFLWHAFSPPEKCRPIMKLVYTTMAIMKEIANDFPDDLSPTQKMTF